MSVGLAQSRLVRLTYFYFIFIFNQCRKEFRDVGSHVNTVTVILLVSLQI